MTTIPAGRGDTSDNCHPQEEGDPAADGSGAESGDTGDPSNNGDPRTDNGTDAPPSFDPGGTGEIMDAGSRNGDDSVSVEAPLDTAAEEQAWDEAMHQALSLAKAQGKAPGAVEETIRGAHASVLDWRTLLRRYMTDAARSDYSWSLPNRRFIDNGLYLPSIRGQGIDTIAVIIDTSASLPARTLAAFWTEVREIAAELQPETVFVLQVDAALQDAADYAAGYLPEEIALKGRGGTDFRPGFAWLAAQGLRPSCCLYFTDMECDSYPRERAWLSYPVVRLGTRCRRVAQPTALGRAHLHRTRLSRLGGARCAVAAIPSAQKTAAAFRERAIGAGAPSTRRSQP